MNAALDLVQLRSFVAIADHGGFGRAAHALHLSQPAVSQHVRSLERRLRCALVERVGRQSQFTAAGERLLVEARRILAVHDEALARLEGPAAWSLSVGVAASLAQGFPALLGRLGEAFDGTFDGTHGEDPRRAPGATPGDSLTDGGLRLLVDRSSHVRAAFESGALDAVAYVADVEARPGRRVARLPLRWVSRPGLALAGAAVPFVGYTAPCGLRSRAERLLAEDGLELRVAAESQSLDGVLAAVRAGLGVTLLTLPGPAPDGLVVRTDLPLAGTADVLLAARAGVEVDVESALLGVLEVVLGTAAPARVGADPSPVRIATDHGSVLDHAVAVPLAS